MELHCTTRLKELKLANSTRVNFSKVGFAIPNFIRETQRQSEAKISS